MLLCLIVWLFDCLFIYLFVYLFAGFPLSFHWLSTNNPMCIGCIITANLAQVEVKNHINAFFFLAYEVVGTSYWIVCSLLYYVLQVLLLLHFYIHLWISFFLFCVQQSEQQKCRPIDCTGRAINAAIANTSLLRRWFPRFFFLGINNNQKQK